ncbi:MAG TPA: hypothetical protein VGF18_02545 [Candidatus Tumulicola sp.]
MSRTVLRVAVAGLAAMLLAVTPSPQDSANIGLATSILNTVGNSIWPNWTSAPFRIDLLTAEGPAEINFAKPVPAPSFPPNLEATFPWDDGVPTIVIGQPQFAQAKTSTRWAVTLLHEHFHQWQDAWPRYFSSVAALGLASPGDNGMWMLNYRFPYIDSDVDASYAAMARQLRSAIVAPDSGSTGRFVSTLANFEATLSPKDRTYFNFQCWQEGVARYTEYAVARAAADRHTRDAAFLTSDQASSLDADATTTYAGILRELNNADALLEDKRVAFYAFGAAEAILLDRISPGWHEKYLDPRLDLSVFFP